MRTFAGLCRLTLLFLVPAWSVQAQSRTPDQPSSSSLASATPCVRVTAENPQEIILGKPATFVFSVTNEGPTPATGVVLATSIPAHVELVNSEPQAFQIEGLVHKFRIGDLGPRTTRKVTLVAVPRKVDPFNLDSTVIFATSTRSSVVVRRPILQVTAQVPPHVVVGQPVDWSVRVTNVGDGAAENVVVTPQLVEGNLQGAALQQAVRVGPLKPGETKEVQFTVVPTQRGPVKATFVGSNLEGLEASHQSTFRALQAELAVKVDGPKVYPMGRSSLYEIQVTNPGDAETGATWVTAKVPTGLKVIATSEKDAYNAATRTLRWQITRVRPTDKVALKFEAETISEGPQTLDVAVKSEGLPEAAATHNTTVISRPNPIVTVLNDREFAAVGEPINFTIVVVNAGSKAAEDLRVRVALPSGLEAVGSSDYTASGSQVTFPARKLASGDKVSLTFRAVGRNAGEHRIQVLVDGLALSRQLTFDGTAFCYSQTEVPDAYTARREPLALPVGR